METETTDKLIEIIIRKKLVPATQIVELSSFILMGYFIDKSLLGTFIFFLVGVFFAMISGEAMIRRDRIR